MNHRLDCSSAIHHILLNGKRIHLGTNSTAPYPLSCPFQLPELTLVFIFGMHFKAILAQNNVGSLPLDHRHTVFSLFLKYVFGIAEVSVAEFQPQEMLSLA